MKINRIRQKIYSWPQQSLGLETFEERYSKKKGNRTRVVECLPFKENVSGSIPLVSMPLRVDTLPPTGGRTILIYYLNLNFHKNLRQIGYWSY